MAYDGFISYSHAADGELAPALQRGLQRLAKPWNHRRALRIFRDETGLSTNPHLWSAIEGALDESEWFVLLASPEGAASEWVNKEIAHWLATKSVDHILPVVTNGTWEWDPATNDFTVGSSAVPSALRGALVSEPRHLDLRWAQSETDLDLRNTRFRSAVADLAAPMHGVAKDDLEGEDIRQHRRARRLARAATTVVVLLLVISIVFGVFAIAQRNRANRSARRANTNAATAEHELLVAESQALLGSNRQLATLLAIEADRRQPSGASRDALLNAVLGDPRLQRTFGGPAGNLGALVGHRVAVLSADRGATPNPNVLQVWNWQTGQRQVWRNAPRGDTTTGPLDIATTADGQLLAVIFTDGMIQLYSGRTLRPQGPAFSSGLGNFVSPAGGMWLSPSGESIAVTSPAGTAGRSVNVFSHLGDRWVSDPPLAGLHGRVDSIALSSDGHAIATASPTSTGSNIVVSAVTSGRPLFGFAAVSVNRLALDWTRRRLVVSTPPGGASDAVWYDLKSPDPTPRVINVGPIAGLGYGVVAYDATDSRLGLDTTNGFRIFDANTLTPLAHASVLATNTFVGPFLFVDASHVLTASSKGGPVSAWDLNGTSVLITHTFPHFNFGFGPAAATGVHDSSMGLSTLGNESTVTVLGPGYRPLGAPIPIEQDLERLPAAVRNAITIIGPLVCSDAQTDRIATVSRATGDIVIRDATPPFRVLSTASGIAEHLAGLSECAWSPDGRQIAISANPILVGTAGAVSVALYDGAHKTLHVVARTNQDVAIASIFFSSDSKSLWIGGPHTGANGVFRVTDLDGTPQVTVEFPGATGISADADGRRFVVSYQTAVQVFDGDTLQPVTQIIPLGSSYITAVSSAPDGRAAVVGSSQGWRLVDLDGQQLIGPWTPGPIGSLAFLGVDNTTVYSQAANGDGQIWNLAPTNVQAAACALAGRNLTTQEWQKYLPWAGHEHTTCAQYPLP